MAKQTLAALRSELNREADAANKRLKALENENDYTEAYHKVYMYTGDEGRSNTRFKRSMTRASKGDAATERQMIQEELKQINKFMNSATSTKTGRNKVIANRISGLETALGQGKFTNKQLNTLYAVFNSDSFARASEVAGDSDPIGDIVGKAIKDGIRNSRGDISKLQVDEVVKTLDYWSTVGGGDVKLLEQYMKELYQIKK